jgi:glycosyltransferase involved in cell wall biosynthesis
MRIVHLVPNLNFGGLQKVVRMLAISQRQAGHYVTVCCWTHASNNPDAEKELETAGVQIIYAQRAANGGTCHNRWTLFRKLKGLLGAGKADILHVHNPFGYYIYGVLTARAAGRTKVINTIHLTAMFDHPRFGGKGRVKFRAAAALTDRIVTVCDEDSSYLQRRFGVRPRKVCVIENGIESGTFLTVPARHRRQEIVFGFAGRMAPEKNHRVLIDAFAMARLKHGNIRLRLLGGGPLEDQIKEQARDLGLGDSVEFCGFSNDVAGFLGSLDIYVLPSDFEALPLSLLEAIASGLPVVATRVGGVPKIVRTTDSGWLCEPGNAESLAGAMELAIDSPERQERGERARRRVVEFYSADRMASDYERLYLELSRPQGTSIRSKRHLVESA